MKSVNVPVQVLVLERISLQNQIFPILLYSNLSSDFIVIGEADCR